MSFKKIRYNTGEGLVKIKIENDTGALMESWAIMFSDLWKWVEIMEKKYGINLKKKEEDKDLDWAK